MVFVNSRPGALLLADAINKVGFKLDTISHVLSLVEVYDGCRDQLSQFLLSLSSSLAPTSLQLVSTGTRPRREEPPFCMTSLRENTPLWSIQVSGPGALTW